MANQKRALTASNIKYLLALYKLSPDSSGIRCVRLAETLGVTKPSVHTMINTLKDMNLVLKDGYGAVSFTNEGEKIAGQYSRYYEFISSYLSGLLPESVDMRSATCAILSEVSTEHLHEMCTRIKQHER